MYVLTAWLLASVPLALLVGKTMRHGLTLGDERSGGESGRARTAPVTASRDAAHVDVAA